jgi:hypothetical protein
VFLEIFYIHPNLIFQIVKLKDYCQELVRRCFGIFFSQNGKLNEAQYRTSVPLFFINFFILHVSFKIAKEITMNRPKIIEEGQAMNNSWHARLPESFYNKMSIYGIKYGGTLDISPLCGRSKSLILNRTLYYFCLSDQVSHLKIDFGKDHHSPPMIHLPSLKGEHACYKCQWIPMSWTTHHSFPLEHQKKIFDMEPRNLKGAFYLIGEREEDILQLNQGFGKSFFAMDGDLWYLGGNCLKFSNSLNHDQTEDTIFYLSNLLKKSKIKSLLLEGETGTGKTFLAQQLHQTLKLPGLFVHLHVASLSPTLIESELFGHVKGAFTGAAQDKQGAFLQAEKGTLFLDEIDSIPKDIQTKLLLAIDSGKIRPVGSNKEFLVRPYLMFASGRSLSRCVEASEMRQDFYFRLQAGLTWKIPALRDRPLILKKFIEEWLYKEKKTISDTLLKEYLLYSWPGNVRQLHSHLEKKLVFSEGDCLIYDEHDEELFSSQCSSLKMLKEYDHWPTLKAWKTVYVKKIFSLYREDLLLTSKILDISMQTLKKYLSEYYSEH